MIHVNASFDVATGSVHLTHEAFSPSLTRCHQPTSSLLPIGLNAKDTSVVIHLRSSAPIVSVMASCSSTPSLACVEQKNACTRADFVLEQALTFASYVQSPAGARSRVIRWASGACNSKCAKEVYSTRQLLITPTAQSMTYS